MPAIFEPRPKPERPAPEFKPSETGQKGVLDHTATQKPDPADLAGPGGNASGPTRLSGRSPRIRLGGLRGTTAAGLGVGLGAAIAIPRWLGTGGAGGWNPLQFLDPQRDGEGKKDDDGGNGDGGILDDTAAGLGIDTGFFILALTAGGLIYLWRRGKKGK